MRRSIKWFAGVGAALSGALLLTAADDKPATPYPGGQAVECAIAIAAAQGMNDHSGKYVVTLFGGDNGLDNLDCSVAFAGAGLNTITQQQIDALPQNEIWDKKDWLTSFSRAYAIDETHAYIIVSGSCGWMCGSGFRYIMKKGPDGWVVESTKPEYVV